MKRIAVLLAIALVGWLATGIYFVQPDQQAVVRRYGKIVGLPREPGPYFGLPWGLDRIDWLKPREVKQVNIGGAAVAGAGRTPARQFLTGDRNLVNVRATVHYTLADPVRYLTTTDRASQLVATSTEAVLARLLAAEPVDRVLTRGKQDLAVRLASELQKLCDRYELGVAVRSVDIGSVEPPAEVADAFDRVVKALRERERAVNQARTFANRTLAEAQADSQQTLDLAQAYRDSTVADARGDADRFQRLLAQYRQAPALTATRLYMETMAAVVPKMRSKLLVGPEKDLDVSIWQEEAP